jgi:hypothetical protein
MSESVTLHMTLAEAHDLGRALDAWLDHHPDTATLERALLAWQLSPEDLQAKAHERAVALGLHE